MCAAEESQLVIWHLCERIHVPAVVEGSSPILTPTFSDYWIPHLETSVDLELAISQRTASTSTKDTHFDRKAAI